MASYIESEIKLRAPNPEAAAELLTTHGFSLRKPRVHESNFLFDTSENALRGSGTVLRIRDVDGAAILTWKAPALNGRHKSREELEVSVSDGRLLREILSRLGYRQTFAYEKFRTEFDDGADGVAVIDETPIGAFLELEGPPSWIDSRAERLGFAPTEYITASYGGLYLSWCEQHHRTPGDMTWSAAQ